MSRKTITKKSAFVILTLIFCSIFSACSQVFSSRTANNNSVNGNVSTDYKKPETVGKIESNEINESSGIVASKCQPDVLWTHNDSDDSAFVYALNTKGEKLGVWRVAGAQNVDWEDIAELKNDKGECFLYLGDIGNNKRDRAEMTIYRMREPQISDADKSSSRKNPKETESAETIKFSYPDMRHDAETLLVHPQTGDIYVLSKSLSHASTVYKLAANYSADKTNKLEKIADFTVPAVPNGLLTGGDISPDGKRVVICDYFAAYEIILPEKAKKFDEIWTQKPVVIELGQRELGEAVGYAADGKSIFATSEKKNSPLIQVRRK